MTVATPETWVREFVRDRAAALDRCDTDTRQDIARLGQLGLLDLGFDGSLAPMVSVIEDVAAESLSAGFTVWAHRMTLEYIDRAPESVRRRLRDRLASGVAVGATAMAAGLKFVAGLGEVPVVASRVDGGLELTGPIRWASNLFDDSVIVVPARSDDGETFVAVVDSTAEGVTIAPAPTLLALNATASTSLTLDHVRVEQDSIVSTDLHGFVTGIRPTFLLLQTAFCSGISGTAVAESAELLSGLGAEFAESHADASDALTHLRDRLYSYALDPGAVSMRDLIRLRLDGADLAMTATRLEVTLRGGAGYAHSSATNRRFREAAFLPVQSPSEGQLRWELTRSE